MKPRRTILLCLTALASILPLPSAAYNVIDSSNIELLGNPYLDVFTSGEAIYARNIWDMQRFKGKIFFGAGNSSNIGPAINAGPVPIIHFDPKTTTFEREGRIDEEQIDLYRILNGQLYIPGHDPRQSWQLGNFYRRNNDGSWKRYRNTPNALHSYDLVLHNKKLFQALGLEGGAAVSFSTDNGQSWRNIPAGKLRAYSFLQVGGNLYASKEIASAAYHQKHNYTSILQVENNFSLQPRPDLSDRVMFPGINFINTKLKKILRSNNIGSKVIYIGAYIHNDHQYDPFGVFIASSLDKNRVDIKRLNIPKGSKPWDIIIRGEVFYILLNQVSSVPPNQSSTEVTVLRASTRNPYYPEKLFSFKSSTFARSFELLDGDFYFGLGSEIKIPKSWNLNELHPDTGNILRIKAQHIR